MMIWPVGGLILWLGGWWFTGRLFGVYRKVVFLEECELRSHGRESASTQHHRGAALFAIFDLGLLLLGIRSLSVLRSGATDPSLVISMTDWSILVSLYLFRQGFSLHRLYHERWRARSGEIQPEHHLAGTWRGLWRESSLPLKGALLTAPLLALVPFVSRLCATIDSWVHLPMASCAPLIAWFLLPQGLLLLAFALPLSRLRRRLFSLHLGA